MLNQPQTTPANGGFEAPAGVHTRTKIVKHHSTRPESWYQWLFRQLCLPEQARILELGSGPCDLWVENWPHISPGWKITAADLSVGMIKEGARRIQSVSALNRTNGRPTASQFHFTILNAGRLPFQPQSCDAVLALGLLDLVEDVDQVLSRIHAALKPGGKLYASAGGRNHLLELEALISPFLPDLRFGGDPDRFGLDNGARLLAPHFENISLARYSDEMVFTSAEPIIAYILSENTAREQLGQSSRDLLQRGLTHLLHQRREIRITTQKGLFHAAK